MSLFSSFLTVSGLCLFESVNSIDNAIINAEVLRTMQPRYRKWFLTWGIFISVFLVRGLLPWIIVFVCVPELGFLGSFTATMSSNPAVKTAVENAAPILLSGGGIFLVFLFFHWLFLEAKEIGFRAEKFFYKHGIWFYAVVSIFLSLIVWYSIKVNPAMAFGAVVGSSVFFITHGFKENAEQAEKKLITGSTSDWSKILYLEAIDASFSIDGVIGAFAFTMSVPLILIGNGLGAIIVRQLTIGNMERIKKYVFLKHGAMYSMFFLGMVMILHSFSVHIPQWVSPVLTFGTIGYFFMRSWIALKAQSA